jgi:hypothetical protein
MRTNQLALCIEKLIANQRNVAIAMISSQAPRLSPSRPHGSFDALLPGRRAGGAFSHTERPGLSLSLVFQHYYELQQTVCEGSPAQASKSDGLSTYVQSTHTVTQLAASKMAGKFGGAAMRTVYSRRGGRG